MAHWTAGHSLVTVQRKKVQKIFTLKFWLELYFTLALIGFQTTWTSTLQNHVFQMAYFKKAQILFAS